MPALRRPSGPAALRMRQVARWPLRVPPPSRALIVAGVTKNAAGAVLGSCTVTLFDTLTDVVREVQTSDAVTGAYQFSAINDTRAYYVRAYKAGAPDVAGTTVNTLVGS